MKKRIFRKSTVICMGAGLLLLFLTFYIKGYTAIFDYLKYIGGESPLATFTEDHGIWSSVLKERNFERTAEIIKSQVFSFYAMMEYGYFLYGSIANLLLTLPVIRFFQERQRGYTNLQLLRYGSFRPYILHEAISCSLGGWLIAVVPALVFWFLAMVLSSSIFPLSQSFTTHLDSSFFGAMYLNHTYLCYLLYILIQSSVFFFTALFAFAISIWLKKAIYVLFSGFLYSYLTVLVLGLMQKGQYASTFSPTQTGNLVSFAPTFVYCFYTFLISMVLLYLLKKDLITNGKN
ncbi:MAG: hypothetical protein U0M15_03475 [Bacillota bacterium]|nr:hypothetical protein [Bacillota bacterium]